jgi:hypothetical protein
MVDASRKQSCFILCIELGRQLWKFPVQVQCGKIAYEIVMDNNASGVGAIWA